MKILVIYATTEGQTRKIARRAVAHLGLRGAAATLVDVEGAAGVEVGAFDGVILLASVHAGRYQAGFVDFVTARRGALAGRPTAFLSVSLSAASSEAEDIEGIDAVVRRFVVETEWTPGVVEHVAGAFRFTQYDFLKSWAMRWIAARRDPEADPSGDTEYTDWDRLYRFLDGWLATLSVPSASVRSGG